MTPVHPKVKAGGAAGAAATILITLGTIVGVHLDAVTASAIVTVLGAAAGWAKRS